MITNKEKIQSGYNEFRRPRYFHGMLLDDQDFLAEQIYHTNKRQLLNRMLHGTGVVCGLGLSVDKTGCVIKVDPGLALDCSGNEIWVDRQIDVKIRDFLPQPGSKAKSACQSGESDKTQPNKHFLGIYYHEQKTDAKSVYVPDGSCEDRSCDYSRVREGFRLTLVKCGEPDKKPGLLKKFCECKDGPVGETKDPTNCLDCKDLTGKQLCRCSVLQDFCKQSIPCSDCGCCEKQHVVILGSVELDKDNNITKLCINDCRRYVLTGRMVDHLLAQSLGGVGNALSLTVGGKDVEFKDGYDIGRNPIEALCWFFRHVLIEAADGKPVTWSLCQKDQTTGGGGTGGTDINRAEFDKMKEEVEELKKLIKPQPAPQPDPQPAPQ
ncbi:MAG: hypothetical protein AB7G75_35390 [Candidatus Binatia bacterium]